MLTVSKPAIRLNFVLVLSLLVACSEAGPTCPYSGPGDRAPSAGCFTVADGKLLLVEGFNGKVSLPGGSSRAGESAQCTAFRETWEETGLQLQPRELLRVFDTGFHLYRCERDAHSGDIRPSLRFEVRAVYFLAPERFEEYEWRFPDQRALLQAMMLGDTSAHSD